ncbi:MULTISPECIES: GNAT family N-acetyltransferase [Asticcacaulis]|uniref:GNAT family N-acetyltransferase n=1 Tax=Asticcacaulis TaxID=76890 RepID=UPI001AE195AA|nr:MULTISPECIES: GNAT family N-acetyltransferase [Asticcacaulis]MBP2158292.1 GNAT superfamily N-acetyltransferase [Asticcacaulis solisilvae]MDR6799337.1 GNAT superfamily N-acetyltransferase [Asticcacaulis sp. BE141]
MPDVKLAETDEDIRRCFSVMRQLRPHLTSADELLERARRQMQDAGWRLAFTESDGQVAACAGFRVHEWLVSGRVLYVDDLVTDDALRSGGHGKALLDWLKDLARSENCAQLRLDSGTHRRQAHKFYFREGLTVQAFHFETDL